MVNEIKNLKKTVGIKQSSKAIKEGMATKAFIAKDAESSVVEPFVQLCKEKGVPIEYIDSCADLGRSCGITVGAAVAVILR